MGVNMKFDTDLLPQYAGRHRKMPSSQRTARRLARRTAIFSMTRDTAGRTQPPVAGPVAEQSAQHPDGE
jgi:hypothetical protein